MTNGDAANKANQATICGLTKKDGGLRSIAISKTFRRLTAKLIGDEHLVPGRWNICGDFVNLLLQNLINFHPESELRTRTLSY